MVPPRSTGCHCRPLPLQCEMYKQLLSGNSQRAHAACVFLGWYISHMARRFKQPRGQRCGGHLLCRHAYSCRHALSSLTSALFPHRGLNHESVPGGPSVGQAMAALTPTPGPALPQTPPLPPASCALPGASLRTSPLEPLVSPHVSTPQQVLPPARDQF